MRTDAAVAPVAKARAAAWDLANSELSFDFAPEGAEQKPPALDWGAKDRAGVKEAIIRWLEEQL